MLARLKIAVAQPLVVPGEVGENIRRMEPLVSAAAQQGADLIVFSECGLTGYDPNQYSCLKAALDLNDPLLAEVDALARSNGVTILAGLYERSGAGVYNAAVVFYPEGRRIVQHKHNIVGREREATAVWSGPRERVLFEVKGVRCAILICADTGIEGIYDELAATGCELILAPTAGGGSMALGFWQSELEDSEKYERCQQMTEWVSCLCHPIESTRKYNLAMVCCNQSGFVPELDYFHPGNSSVVNAHGEVTAAIRGCTVFEQLQPQLAVGWV